LELPPQQFWLADAVLTIILIRQQSHFLRGGRRDERTVHLTLLSLSLMSLNGTNLPPLHRGWGTAAVKKGTWRITFG